MKASHHPIGKPVAPSHLQPATREWWQSVVTRWDLEPHHIKLLTMAAVSWDRHEEARAVVAAEGLTVATRDGGARVHPAVKIEMEARVQFARLLRELDLDLDTPAAPAPPRPPKLRSIR
jgi:phage terminase small subunit